MDYHGASLKKDCRVGFPGQALFTLRSTLNHCEPLVLEMVSLHPRTSTLQELRGSKLSPESFFVTAWAISSLGESDCQEVTAKISSQ